MASNGNALLYSHIYLKEKKCQGSTLYCGRCWCNIKENPKAIQRIEKYSDNYQDKL